MATRRAMVTGASEGIGRAIAKALAADGYEIMGVARNDERLKELVQELGGTAHTVMKADLSTSEGVAKVAAALKAEHFDVLINNAGVGHYGEFTDVPEEKLVAMMQINCMALMNLSYAFLQNARKGDALVNVSSTLAFLPMPTSAVYAATKAYVTSFSESLWYEQRKRGVYVMNLCPGLTTSQFHTRAGGTDDKRRPQNLFQSAETVANVMLCHLKARSCPTVVSGAMNRSMAFMTRFMPRSSVVKMMGSVG